MHERVGPVTFVFCRLKKVKEKNPFAWLLALSLQVKV
jgi:hypothetical protein